MGVQLPDNGFWDQLEDPEFTLPDEAEGVDWFAIAYVLVVFGFLVGFVVYAVRTS